tara:strand:+ start:1774 stop:2091 length:318 start_codon:yes stop_codon:yes gene_type:complete
MKFKNANNWQKVKPNFLGITSQPIGKKKYLFYDEIYNQKIKGKGSKKVSIDNKIDNQIKQVDYNLKRKLTTNEKRKLKKLYRQVFVLKTKGIESIRSFHENRKIY